MHSIPGKALTAGISSGISHLSEGSGSHSQCSQTRVLRKNNFPKKSGREKPHPDAISDWIYPEFQEREEFFWIWKKRAQHRSSFLLPAQDTAPLLQKHGSWFVHPADPTIFQPTTSSHNPTWLLLSNQIFLDKIWDFLTKAPLDIPKLGKIPKCLVIILMVKVIPG